ncbi:MAG: tol-pal system-associated acyl-CoA thioesterase [Alphaproteobacteria bacterium]|nr:tol-pal system-associated acyl-CoA thioesterase [Alphaproteobacteria bacterium]
MNAPHVFRTRVYYEDTDAAGIVYYANYLKFAERARTEILREAGIVQREMADAMGIAFAVRSVSVDYIRPARLDDALVVESETVAVGGATADGIQTVRRAADGAELARLRVKLACLKLADGRPTRIPEAVRAALARHIVVTKA